MSKFTSPKCRFYPLCSSYAIVAIMRYGFLKGVFLSIKRILKCNIFSKGGGMKYLSDTVHVDLTSF